MPHTVMYDKHLFVFWPKQAYAEIVIPILVIYWFSINYSKINNCYRKLYTFNRFNNLFKENELNHSLGLCMVFIEKKNILNHYNCSMFNGGCPNFVYYSDEMYKCMYSLHSGLTNAYHIMAPNVCLISYVSLYLIEISTWFTPQTKDFCHFYMTW